MKEGIHPEYKETTVKCVCGNSWQTKSTVAGSMSVDICSACHPYYTGKQKLVDTAGRVERFRKRWEKADKNKPAAQPAPASSEAAS